ncbi:MAG: hypothetical protein AB7K24_00585 [Gemmataceae bacterium]
MSTPPGKDASVVQTTQKQLEELDALIQKMLELPVSQLEEDPFNDMPIPAMPTSAPPSPLRTRSERPAASSASPTAPAQEPAESSTKTGNTEAPADKKLETIVKKASPEANKNRERLETQFTRKATPAAPEPPAGKKPMARLVGRLPRLPDDWHLLPLLWPNRAFDQLTTRCGRPGIWLRGRSGRLFLGITGIVLAVAACAWAILDWIAWNW